MMGQFGCKYTEIFNNSYQNLQFFFILTKKFGVHATPGKRKAPQTFAVARLFIK